IFGSAFEAQWYVPNYTAAVESNDGVAVYREFRRLLQTLRWLRRDTSDRPWVLKVPQFAQDLPALLKVFPDARVIYLSRDPLDVVASSASLVCNQMSLQSHSVDPHWIGREWSRKVRLREARMLAAKTTATVPQIELAYEDVGRNWLSEMQRVYRMLRLPLDDRARAAMADYVRSSEPGRRRPHHYDPVRFGLVGGGPGAIASAG
ncbi:MAG TPA: sulfotransferase, partial [Sphingomicrobium sp.]